MRILAPVVIIVVLALWHVLSLIKPREPESLNVYVYKTDVALFQKNLGRPKIFNESGVAIITEKLPDGWAIVVEGEGHNYEAR